MHQGKSKHCIRIGRKMEWLVASIVTFFLIVLIIGLKVNEVKHPQDHSHTTSTDELESSRTNMEH